MFKRAFNFFAILAILAGLIAMPVPAVHAQEGDDVSAEATQTGVFAFAKRAGGIYYDAGHQIVVDGSGNIYIAGVFTDTVDFDPGAGTSNLTSAGEKDGFVLKLTSSGDFVWAVKMGGSEDDIALDIALDDSGNIYITGAFKGTANFGGASLTSVGETDAFVAKIGTGGTFLWAKRLGGSGGDAGSSLAVDGSGNVYTAGAFNGTVDFDPGAGTSNLTSAGFTDIFISKLNTSGAFVWAKSMGGASNDVVYSIAVSASGEVYTTGYFWGVADFSPDASEYNLNSGNSSDVFVSKLNSSGNFDWAVRMGGDYHDIGYGIALDSSEDVYVTGAFYGNADFGSQNLSSNGDRDAFVVKMSGSSGSVAWARGLGGGAEEFGNHLAVDGNKNVYVIGTFNGTADFDPGAGTFNLTSAGGIDAFISKLNGSGNFVWAKRMGGSKSDIANGIAVSNNGAAHITGAYVETAKFGAHALTNASTGFGDMFVTKLVNGNIATLESLAAEDGWILESTETSNKGGKLNKGATTLRIGDDAANKQYRAILSFDTSPLAPQILYQTTIHSVTLRFKYAGKTGTLPFNTHGKLLADIRKGPFSNNPSLQLGDFNAGAGKNKALAFTKNTTDGWYSMSLTPGDFQYINTGGVTQFRLRFTKDDNNDLGADFLTIFSGNADPANRPQLIVEYTVTPLLIFP